MILAAGYLLCMYGRVVFGEVSDFLEGLGDHLTDMTPVEILTLAPLGALVVIFGLQPGPAARPRPRHGQRDAPAVEAGGTDRDPDRRSWSASCADPGRLVLARIAWALVRPSRGSLEPETGAAH